MSVTTLLIIILIVFLIGGAPGWGIHNRGWGPSGMVGVLLAGVIVGLVLLGKI